MIGMSVKVSQAKPGGWIKDFFQNNSVTVAPGYFSSSPAYYNSRPTYYTERPIYYCPTPVIYERPVYYYPAPRVVPMQPYQNYYRRGY